MYEFREDDAYEFARFVGIPVKPHNDELFFKTCPYCKPKPQRGNLNTFSINLKTGQFKCFRASCGVSGNFITLAKDFDFSLGNMADEYYRPKKSYRKFRKKIETIKPKSEAVKYLESRGIPQEITERYAITVQADRPNILVFPFFDENGVMQFIKYRKTDFDREKDKNKEWCEPDCRPILFGMYQCNDKFDRLIITEGQLDSLSVAAAGVENAVSVPNGAKGFTWLPYCWNWMNRFHEIIVFGDHEKGHITLLAELSSRLKTVVKHVREDDYLGCKDANEILQKHGVEAVRNAVNNAVLVPIKRVIELSDVEDVDIYEIPKLRTGINQLDRLLYGGLPSGGVILISGKAGHGKSTLASQILANAIHQGKICFAYSGELPNYQFKAWLNFQIAGRNRIVEYQNKWGDRGYSISKMNRQMIDDWYRDKCYLYDNSDISGDEKDDLLKLTENVIMQYGANVILLDNLMTALDLVDASAYDKYDKQSLFVKQLARLALKHNVWILLVAHKRKNNFSQNENDEISGSGDISNLATITIAYERGKDIEPDQRLLKVSKNRLFGKVEMGGFVLNYDEKSKRIYGQGDNLNFDFGWDKKSGKQMEIEDFQTDNGETPFDT